MSNVNSGGERGAEAAYPLPETGSWPAQSGLTIREYYAGLAMQAILTGAVTRGCPSHEWLEQDLSVKVADALLAALSGGRT